MIEVQIKKTRDSNWLTPQERYGFQLVDVKGVNPPKANVSTSALSGIDGSYFISSRLNARNIVLTYKPIANGSDTIEARRRSLIDWFEQNQQIDLCLITETREAYISGYVESVEYDVFENPQLVQVSIICPESNFKAAGPVSYPLVFRHDMAYDFFTASIPDESDCDIGYTLDFIASADIGKVAISSSSFYRDVPEEFVVDIQSGDQIIINTQSGRKSITKNGEPYYEGYEGEFAPLMNREQDLGFALRLRCYNANGTNLWGEVLSGTVSVTQLYRGL